MLGRFVPEFGRIVAMMQFNMYHHYTVDEHLIRAIGVLAEIEHGRPRRATIRSPTRCCRRIKDRDGALRRAVPARHRQGPAGGPLDRRRPGRAPALPAPRPDAGRDRDASPGWSSIT